jgi:hypothetical protein
MTFLFVIVFYLVFIVFVAPMSYHNAAKSLVWRVTIFLTTFINLFIDLFNIAYMLAIALGIPVAVAYHTVRGNRVR